MNKINEFKYLKDWCDEYYKTVGLKIHPSNVPVDVVLDDIMGHITMLIAHEKQFISWIDFARGQIKALQEEVLNLKVQVLELANPIETPKKGKKND